MPIQYELYLMTKNPSINRSSDITHYRQAKTVQKRRNIYKLLDEIVELERQLKIHPMGAIILKSKIKEKRAKLRQLDPEGNTSHNDDQMKNSAQQGKLGLTVTGLPNLGKEQNLFKFVYEDETLKATPAQGKYRTKRIKSKSGKFYDYTKR